MAKLISNEADNGYYAIGSDFYKTECNLPSGGAGKRTIQTFYFHSLRAKTVKMTGFDICWLNFEDIPPSYRKFQPPAVLYDSMIFVAQAKPTNIITEK